MDPVEEYKRNAKECRELARRMPPDQRQQLQEMAEQWEGLAQDRLKALAAPPSGNDGS